MGFIKEKSRERFIRDLLRDIHCYTKLLNITLNIMWRFGECWARIFILPVEFTKFLVGNIGDIFQVKKRYE